MANREGDRLELRVHAELAQDVANVRLHGLRADEQRLRDVLVAPSARQHVEDLALALGELLEHPFRILANLSLSGQGAEHRGRSGVQPGGWGPPRRLVVGCGRAGERPLERPEEQPAEVGHGQAEVGTYALGYKLALAVGTLSHSPLQMVWGVHMYREARMMRIVEGTSEIQRLLIARGVLNK